MVRGVNSIRHRILATLKRPAVAAMAVALALTGASVAAANGQLTVFQAKRIAPISLTTADLMALPDLRSYGEFQMTDEPDVHDVADAAAAAADTGLEMPVVSTLPRGVTGQPEYQAGAEIAATFTFSAERAAKAAADAGATLPPVPPGLDGSQVRLVAGPGVAALWSQPSGIPSLVVGRAVAPRATASGVPFETVRDYLLSLPGVPADVAAQLRTFAADGSTLPLPVPADRFLTSSAKVDGVDATVLSTRDRSMAATVWLRDGLVTVVAGALSADEVLAVARGLR